MQFRELLRARLGARFVGAAISARSSATLSSARRSRPARALDARSAPASRGPAARAPRARVLRPRARARSSRAIRLGEAEARARRPRLEPSPRTTTATTAPRGRRRTPRPRAPGGATRARRARRRAAPPSVRAGASSSPAARLDLAPRAPAAARRPTTARRWPGRRREDADDDRVRQRRARRPPLRGGALRLLRRDARARRAGAGSSRPDPGTCVAPAANGRGAHAATAPRTAARRVRSGWAAAGARGRAGRVEPRRPARARVFRVSPDQNQELLAQPRPQRGARCRDRAPAASSSSGVLRARQDARRHRQRVRASGHNTFGERPRVEGFKIAEPAVTLKLRAVQAQHLGRGERTWAPRSRRAIRLEARRRHRGLDHVILLVLRAHSANSSMRASPGPRPRPSARPPPAPPRLLGGRRTARRNPRAQEARGSIASDLALALSFYSAWCSSVAPARHPPRRRFAHSNDARHAFRLVRAMHWRPARGCTHGRAKTRRCSARRCRKLVGKPRTLMKCNVARVH